jgi:hypothetical protein
LQVQGRATIQAQTVSHPAVPAEDMMQAFAYRHLVPVQELKLAVLKPFAAKASQKRRGAGKSTPKKK